MGKSTLKGYLEKTQQKGIPTINKYLQIIFQTFLCILNKDYFNQLAVWRDGKQTAFFCKEQLKILKEGYFIIRYHCK